MLRFNSEGQPFHIGLNLSRARGGFVVAWVWYDVERYELTVRRFRVRLHMRPWFLRTMARSNVIDDYLAVRNLVLINDEVLADMKEVEAKPNELQTNQP